MTHSPTRITTTAAQFTIGATATITHLVGPADSATAWGNDIDVLATPVLLWLTEIAAMKAIANDINSERMTVGSAHATTHLAPTPTGETVTVTATLIAVTDRLLTFEVTAEDARGPILRGEHTRGLVDTARFRSKVAALTGSRTATDQG